MAVINKQFIHFAKKATLENHLKNNEILPTSIVFVKETGEIYVNGQYYTNFTQTTTNSKDIETIKEQSGWWIEEDLPYFRFGSVESHKKAKADAVVGDICYYGETPIGVVVIKNEDKVKVMSLFELNEDGTDSLTHKGLTWGVYGDTTNVTDIDDGKANTTALVEKGSDYKAAIACSLYSTEGTKQGDWYLPANLELEDMQWSTNKTAIQASLNSLDTLALSLSSSKGYWSSTERSSNYAYFLSTDYEFGGIYNCDKNYDYFVRAFLEL